MTIHQEDELIENKHLKLSKWAQIANILAWFSLVIAIILAIIYIPTELAREEEMFRMTGYNAGEKTYLEELQFFFEAISIFLKGLLSTFVFKAISLGLYMLVEIDLNYKLLEEE